MADDHGRQAISCYGGRLIKTPNIDRLAQGGTRFTQAFANNSICSPSRAVLLTGKYNHLCGVEKLDGHFDGATDVSETAATGRLPDRHRRQVAPFHRADRVRLLLRTAWIRQVVRQSVQGKRSTLGGQRQSGRRRPPRLFHGRHHGHFARLAEEQMRARQTLLLNDPSPRTAFAARSGSKAQGDVQGNGLPRTTHSLGRLPRACAGAGGRQTGLVALAPAV